MTAASLMTRADGILDRLKAVVGPAGFLEAADDTAPFRTSFGGTAPANVTREAAEWRARLQRL